MNKIYLFIDDHSIAIGTTEFKDLYLGTNDIRAWQAKFCEADPIKEKGGIAVAFNAYNEESGFSLEMSYSAAEELLRVLRDVLGETKLYQ